MGLASRGFAIEYPEVCENTHQAVLFAHLNDEKAKLIEELKQYEEQQRNLMRRQRWEEAFAEIDGFFNRVQEIGIELMDLLKKLNKLSDEELLNNEVGKKARKDIEDIEREKTRFAERIRENENQQRRLDTVWGRIFRSKYLQKLKEEKTVQ